MTRIIAGAAGAVLLVLFTISYATAQVWWVARFGIRLQAAEATSAALAEPRTVWGEILASGVLLLCGGTVVGCVLVAAGIVTSPLVVAVMAGVGLGRWVTIATHKIRLAIRLRDLTGTIRPARPVKLTTQQLTTIVFGAALCLVIADEARRHDGWSQDWRITAAAGIGTATLVAYLFEIPRSPSRLRRNAVAVATIVLGPLVLVLAGVLPLNPWGQGIVTELGVGLSLIGIIDVLIRESERLRVLMDDADQATAQRAVNEATTDLLPAEALAFRGMVELRYVHDPARHDAHLAQVRTLVTTARTEPEQRLATRLAQLRAQRQARARELLPGIAQQYGLTEEPWSSLLVHFATTSINQRDLTVDDVPAELSAAARIMVVKKTADRLRTTPTNS